MSAWAQHRVFDRYIDALLSLAGASSSRQLWLDQARVFHAALTTSPDFSQSLTDPRLNKAQKEQLVASVASYLKLDENLTRALRLMVRQGRGASLAAFATRLAERLNKDLGVVVANVTAAKDLTPAQTQELSRSLGGNVELNTTIDPEILGGLIVQIGSWRMDDSVKGKLERLARRLNKAA